MSRNVPPAFHLRVLTPREVLCDTEAKEVTLPGLDGYLGILPGHRPLVVALGKGKIHYLSEGEEEEFSVRGGYAEILPGEVTVFTEISQDEDKP